MSWLKGLYPASWRRRYGAEFDEILRAEGSSLARDADLVRGAGEAWRWHFAERRRRAARSALLFAGAHGGDGPAGVTGDPGRPSPGPRRRARPTAGALNFIAAVVIAAVVLTLALQSHSATPPAIAEFAPQAQQIKQAPQEQSSLIGQAAGGAALPAAPTASPAAAGTAVLNQCVGDPPRQIDDPQSPPCVPFWQGDNGGATSPGVTRDTINLVEPSDCQASNGSGQSAAEYTDLVRFFNQRFEFYGRKVHAICLQSGEGSNTRTGQMTDAASVENMQPPVFASAMYRNGASQYYVQQVACAHHIVTVTYYILPRSKSYLDECPGYIYQYTMDLDTMAVNLGEWTCARLAGGSAVHAAGNDNEIPPKPLRSLPRKFGIIYEPSNSDEPFNVETLREQLAACGIDVSNRDVLDDPIIDSSGQADPVDPAQATNAMAQLRSDNVTSVLCLCNLYSFGALARGADSQSYYPEWLVTTYGGLDASILLTDLGGTPPDQLAQLFGLSFKPRELPPVDEPYYQAMREVDPTNNPKGPDSLDVEVNQEVYRTLLVLMSGFQMAGPRLTPQTFSSGLAAAVFPNPDTPTLAGHVSFAGHTYSMTIDAAEFWWGNGQRSPYPDTAGAICYVGGGVRHATGQWPRGGDPFFTGPCDGVTPTS